MMLLAEHSSEFDRMCACGRSVCTTTLGLRGSETSTPVKFFGALSCASHMMRRPSLAIVMDMPSPMPPKPPRLFWASSLKFQVMGSPVWVNGLLAAGIQVSGACGCRGKACAHATEAAEIVLGEQLEIPGDGFPGLGQRIAGGGHSSLRCLRLSWKGRRLSRRPRGWSITDYAMAFLRNSVRSVLLQSGIALIFFSLSRFSDSICMS